MSEQGEAQTAGAWEIPGLFLGLGGESIELCFIILVNPHTCNLFVLFSCLDMCYILQTYTKILPSFSFLPTLPPSFLNFPFLNFHFLSKKQKP